MIEWEWAVLEGAYWTAYQTRGEEQQGQYAMAGKVCDDCTQMGSSEKIALTDESVEQFALTVWSFETSRLAKGRGFRFLSGLTGEWGLIFGTRGWVTCSSRCWDPPAGLEQPFGTYFPRLPQKLGSALDDIEGPGIPKMGNNMLCR